ncbi:hypothetical protein VTN31DRAFT_5239 [Thermomyces dupontii]|uniref:uncharacterized protein n=1 Tax=Talaromyces thermophilus TaxID=28565 RepID=UPI00374352E1
MEEPIREIPVGDLCCLRGHFVITSQPSDPQAEKQKFSGVIHIISDFDYLLGVPREQELPVQVAYHNPASQTFLQGAFVNVSGLLLVDYDSEGKPHLTLAPDELRPQPGDPSTREYVEQSLRSFPMLNPSVVLSGIVTAIPLDKPECRVYTLHVHVPHEDGSTGLGWDGTYSDYEVHCAIPMTVRWGNQPLPQVNDLCFVTGELSGLYRVGDRQSPLVYAMRMGIINRPPLEGDLASIDNNA